MTQTAIPFLLMRGGTSRGLYFNRANLPEDRDTLAAVLNAAMGAGQPVNADGMGGGQVVTNKVAMLSAGSDGWADVDYFFAQVSPTTALDVDFRPTCGNILSGVGAAALEMGIVAAQGDETRLRIRAVNTGARVEAVVQTPGGQITYEGDAAIDGIPGTAAPVHLNFMDTVGTLCGAMLPTGHASEEIDGVAVTLIDVTMPMMIARAADLGLTGDESKAAIDGDTALLARLEALRTEAGRRMGLGDVSASVTPKVGLLAPPRGADGALAARYLTPRACHPTMAVSGGQCIAACALLPGSVAAGLAVAPKAGPANMRIEHPMGHMDVLMDFTRDGDALDLRSAGVLRTARLIARGAVMVPAAVWGGGV